MGLTGDEIYKKLVEQKVGTEGLFQSKNGIFALVGEYRDLSNEIKRAAEEMEQYWKGDAAGAAQRGFGPAAVSYSTMGESLDKAQDLTRAQAETFDEVHPKIKPIPSVPAEPSGMSNFMSYVPGLSEMTGSGEEVKNYDNAMAAKQEAEANNIRHYSHLATSTDYNVGNLPAQYAPQEAEQGNMSVGGGPGGSGHGGGESGGNSGGQAETQMSVGPANAGGGAHSGSAGAGSAGSASAPHLGGGVSSTGPNAASGPQPSHAGGDAMPAGSSVPSAPAGTSNSSYAPPTPPDGPSSGLGGYSAGGPTSGGSGAGYGGLGSGFVGGLGGSGGTSGASPRTGNGARSGAGFEDGARGGAGAKGGAESGPKSGARSGAGAGRMAEEPTAGARGAAGASGSGRAGGMPMGGGAGAGKKDDKEHETASYLVTQDNGNEIVGDLPATAPPVIGGDLEPPRANQG